MERFLIALAGLVVLIALLIFFLAGVEKTTSIRRVLWKSGDTYFVLKGNLQSTLLDPILRFRLQLHQKGQTTEIMRSYQEGDRFEFEAIRLPSGRLAWSFLGNVCIQSKNKAIECQDLTARNKVFPTCCPRTFSNELRCSCIQKTPSSKFKEAYQWLAKTKLRQEYRTTAIRALQRMRKRRRPNASMSQNWR